MVPWEGEEWPATAWESTLVRDGEGSRVWAGEGASEGASGGSGATLRTAVWVLLNEGECSPEELVDRVIELGLDRRFVANLPFVLGSMADEQLVASRATEAAIGSDGATTFSMTDKGRSQLREAIAALMRRRDALDAMVGRYLSTQLDSPLRARFRRADNGYLSNQRREAES